MRNFLTRLNKAEQEISCIRKDSIMKTTYKYPDGRTEEVERKINMKHSKKMGDGPDSIHITFEDGYEVTCTVIDGEDQGGGDR